MEPVSAPVRHAVFGVAIGPNAMAERLDDPALHRAIHEELLEDLAIHGRLVFNSDAELSLFVAAVRQLPTNLAKAWEAVLSSRRVTVTVRDPETEPDISQITDPAALEAMMAPSVELVLVEADHAELLGVPRDEFSSRTPGGLVEIGRLSTAARTATILAAHHLMDAPLREGGNREDEWSERFGPLVESATPIVVYDKYVGVQCARRYIYGRKFGDGLTWLLHRVAMHPGRRVRVITAVPFHCGGPEPLDQDVLARAFRLLLAGLGGDVRLDLVLVPERVPGPSGRRIERFGHDRHVRFGNRAVLALGMGVQSFSEPHFRETITVARLPVADAKEREERATRGAIRPPHGGWLIEPEGLHPAAAAPPAPRPAPAPRTPAQPTPATLAGSTAPATPQGSTSPTPPAGSTAPAPPAGSTAPTPPAGAATPESPATVVPPIDRPARRQRVIRRIPEPPQT